MKKTKYRVTFKKNSGHEVVYASSGNEAIILAQAERIKKGLIYEVFDFSEIKE